MEPAHRGFASQKDSPAALELERYCAMFRRVVRENITTSMVASKIVEWANLGVFTVKLGMERICQRNGQPTSGLPVGKSVLKTQPEPT